MQASPLPLAGGAGGGLFLERGADGLDHTLNIAENIRV